ncbi:hypothetical protein A4G20_10745 [Pasteurellaceae bacterium RH1A]|nr:hypothetical protein A4G20_10745 [Pasteurellaceae bacterium RH1A]
MPSLYDQPDMLSYVQEVKDFYLNLDLKQIQASYHALDFEKMDWFYARYTSYYDYAHLYNELNEIKYRVLKSKKVKNLLDAINQKIDVSGVIDNTQIIFFSGTGIASNTNYIPATIRIKEYYVNVEISKDLLEVKKIVSVFKKFILNADITLDVGIGGDYKGERSALTLDEYKKGKKYKTISASNDEMFFNPHTHKINNEYFYEFEGEKLKKIYFIGKDGSEVSRYF